MKAKTVMSCVKCIADFLFFYFLFFIFFFSKKKKTLKKKKKHTRKCVYETLCPQLVSHFQDVKMSKK